MAWNTDLRVPVFNVCGISQFTRIRNPSQKGYSGDSSGFRSGRRAVLCNVYACWNNTLNPKPSTQQIPSLSPSPANKRRYMFTCLATRYLVVPVRRNLRIVHRRGKPLWTGTVNGVSRSPQRLNSRYCHSISVVIIQPAVASINPEPAK